MTKRILIGPDAEKHCSLCPANISFTALRLHKGEIKHLAEGQKANAPKGSGRRGNAPPFSLKVA